MKKDDIELSKDYKFIMDSDGNIVKTNNIRRNHCILPWINFATNIFGKPRICGYSYHTEQWKSIFEKKGLEWPPSKETPEKLKGTQFEKEFLSWSRGLQNSSTQDEWNGLYFREIRKSFLKNEWPENCKRCKHVEELNGRSKRMDENHMWSEKYKDLVDLTNEDGSVPYHPPHMDVRTGTVCNFKCIHCSPASSSRWLEDRNAIEKYGYEHVVNDNTWIAKENTFWDSLDISQIKRYNFLGGESFYNKRHNDFIKKLNESKYANEVEIAYVSNGSLKFENMQNFKKVRLRLSVDCPEKAGEYFRYGLNWNDWCQNIKEFPPNFDVSFQWTCSNVSMFYLIDTYNILRDKFPNIRFLFENHVTEPYHLSVQNLPLEIKEEIKEKINKCEFDDTAKEKIPFYVNHMFEKDPWSEKGKIFIEYLQDLDRIRNTNWKESLCGLENRLNGLI